MKENKTLAERLRLRLIRLQDNVTVIEDSYNSGKYFTVPIIYGRKLIFKVPKFLTAQTLMRLEKELDQNKSLDANKDHDKTAALAAIVLLQHFNDVSFWLFKSILKKLLKRSVDSNKTLALFDLLYTKTFTGLKN
ncbi:hypothetical protein [Sphingobacterium cavernae]|uniref:hypothetical protein n=1 Tax=Sphingobacterium cavernae TaxID=2592657 RepID=UPI00122FEB1C|nr:hypothetical protein [Sphingobacterium cavernae]